MHISDVHDYCPPPSEEAKAFLTEEREKELKSLVESIINDEYDRLREYADEQLSQTAAFRAERYLEKVLAGDKDAAMALLGDKMGGSRRRIMGCDEGKPWASLIHGRLFETSGIEMRRKIVEAHPDLLRNERIADLESVVDGLSHQVRALTQELEDCRNRLH